MQVDVEFDLPRDQPREDVDVEVDLPRDQPRERSVMRCSYAVEPGSRRVVTIPSNPRGILIAGFASASNRSMLAYSVRGRRGEAVELIGQCTMGAQGYVWVPMSAYGCRWVPGSTYGHRVF